MNSFRSLFKQFEKINKLLPEADELSKTVYKTTKNIYSDPSMLLNYNENKYRDVYKKWGEIGILDHKNNNINPLLYGLINYNIEKVDSGLRSAYSVQTSLVINPIEKFGNDLLKNKYLQDLYDGKKIGCFGLTEPNAGSDPSSMTTFAKKQKDYYIVNGSKTWITNSPIADLFIIWCKDENNKIIGLVSERSDTIKTPTLNDKISLLSSPTGQIFFDDHKVPITNKLNIVGLKGPFNCLNKARYGISWGVLGAMDNCIETAISYLNERKQFLKFLSSNQLIQNDIVKCVQLYHSSLNNSISSLDAITEFKDLEDNLALISFLKKSNCENAIDVARITRDLLGGNGISNSYNIMRHLINLEAVNTYEGTKNIHSLILGRHLFDKSAF
jgi:glutaryl-CoA dehydrogenase